MNNSKLTKRALLTSVMALFLCVAMLTGTTFAWFTDTVTSSGNKIIAGDLKVDLEVLNETSGDWISVRDMTDPIFNYEYWEPGYVQVKILRVVNEGSLALKWKAALVSANELSELANVIDVYVKEGVTEYPTDRTTVSGWDYAGTLKEFVNNFDANTNGTIEANATKDANEVLAIAFKMREEADNKYKGKSLGEFDITILATQLDAESDSIDDQYDKDADFVAEVSTFADLARALKSGGKVVITEDIVVDPAEMNTTAASVPVALAIVDGQHVELDLNGHDITVESGASTSALLFVQNSTVNVVGEGNLNLNDDGFIVWAKGNSTVNVYGGNMNGGKDETSVFYASSNEANKPESGYATINVYGGSFDSISKNNPADRLNIANVMNHGAGRVVYYGGTFGWNPTSSEFVHVDDAKHIIVAPTYEITDNGDGTWSVARSKVVNFEENISDEFVVREEDEMTLNMNDKALNNTLTNNGDVIVNGGAINTTGNNALYNEGNAELKDVTVTMTGSTGYITNSRTEDSVTVYENVTATSSGGGVNVWQGEAVFKSGTITTNSTSTSARHMFYIADGAKLTIEDGEFIFNPTNLTRKGSYICAQANAEVIVNGGTFHKPSTRTAPIQSLDGATVTIYGGKFQFDPSAFVADGYEAVEANGWWTVSAK